MIMARPSKIDRLPLQIRDKVRTLREAGRTIDEIYEKLGELDVDVSRSSVGRHIQNLDKILEMTRESRKAAEMICERIGENPDNRVARANIEILHAQIMRLNTATETGEAVRFDPQEVYFLSKALHSLTSASKVDATQSCWSASVRKHAKRRRRRWIRRWPKPVGQAGRDCLPTWSKRSKNRSCLDRGMRCRR